MDDEGYIFECFFKKRKSGNWLEVVYVCICVPVVHRNFCADVYCTVRVDMQCMLVGVWYGRTWRMDQVGGGWSCKFDKCGSDDDGTGRRAGEGR